MGDVVGRRFVLLLVTAVAVLAVLVASAGGSRGGGPQELTVTASDGAKLACALVEPDSAAPTDGYPAVMLFHGLGGTHADMEPLATATLAPAGYASLMCDARGTGASEGQWDLDGARSVQDARDLFAWLAARPEISDTQIGALGLSLGGGGVWNAAAGGVPFKAIVPIITWTTLSAALATQGLAKSGLVALLSLAVPTARWEPDLLAAKAPLEQGAVPAQVKTISAARSPRPAALTVPTLLVQGRRDFLFDEAQAKAAYRSLAGPKRLYLGDLGHAPASNPVAELPTVYALALAWFDRFLRGKANGVDKGAPVQLARDPWDGRTTTYTGLPPTHTASVMLPGTTTLHTGESVSRGARLTGGLHETFGGGTVTVRYASAAGWDRLVAVVSVGGRIVTLGGARIGAPSGVATIRLLDESALVPAGARVTLTVGATSGPTDPTYAANVPPGSSIVVGRTTLALSLLKRAVSH